MFELKRISNSKWGIEKYVQNQIEKHQYTFNEANIRDYIDAFLLEMRQHPLEGAGKDHSFESTLHWVYCCKFG